MEGLVHVSEMDWTNKNVNPSKVVQLGDDVEVMVLDVDAERRRILAIHQAVRFPIRVEAFAAMNKKGDKVSGQIKSITDFGIFIGLEGGIDGLVHLSDISWNTTGEDVVRNYKKGDTLEAVVLAVDPERERISLGVKQMEQDPIGTYMATTQKGAIVTGTVKEVDAKGATIELDGGIEGYVRASDIAKERVEDASQHLKVGDSVEAKYMGMDRKGRVMQLSIRAKDEADVAESMAEVNKQAVGRLERHHQARRLLLRDTVEQGRVKKTPEWGYVKEKSRKLKRLATAGNPPAVATTPEPHAARWPQEISIDMTKTGTHRDPLASSPGPPEGRRRGHGGQDPARDDEQRVDRRRPDRDPRLRQLLPAFPSAAPGPQSQDR